MFARRPVLVVLVRLVHVPVALAVLHSGQDVAEQRCLAILKLPGEFVQDRALHSTKSSDRKDRVDVGAQGQRVTEREQRRRVDENYVESSRQFVEHMEQSFVPKHVTGRRRDRPRRQEVQKTARSRLTVRTSTASVEVRPLLDFRHDRDWSQSLRQLRTLHRDIGDARTPTDMKQPTEVRTSQVEVHHDDASVAPSKCDTKIRDRRRLALLLDGGRDHDRAQSSIGIEELETCPELAKRLRLSARRLMEHDEIVGLLKRPGRLGYTSKQRDSEGLFDLVLVAHATIERLGEEGERDSEDAAEQEAEDGIAPRSRPCLRRTLRRLKHARATRHQLPDSCELTLLLNERRVERRVGLPLGGWRDLILVCSEARASSM